MAPHVFHWKHGWIPLDHVAAGESRGIRSRSDVARSVRSIGQISAKDAAARRAAKVETVVAANRHGARDLLPNALKTSSIEAAARAEAAVIPAGVVRDLSHGSAAPHLVRDAHGVVRFAPERAALHEKIINRVLGSHKAQAHPAFVMLGGGGASGKTKLARAAAVEFPDAATINPDDIRAMLPEYVPGDRASSAFSHEEASYISKQAVTRALARRHHVILDAVGDSSVGKVEAKIRQARAAGYTPHARYVTVPMDEALRRAEVRGQKTGRFVPEPELIAAHAGVSDVFPKVIDQFQTATLHDNTGALTLVASRDPGHQPTIHNQRLWQGFLSKANLLSR